NLTIEVEMVQERPVDALINAAAARNAEAIAVGHGGSGPLKAALLGSITYEIVHRAPFPCSSSPTTRPTPSSRADIERPGSSSHLLGSGVADATRRQPGMRPQSRILRNGKKQGVWSPIAASSAVS
ncbi:MAG: universal stress protein, partial [Acidimicrobiaceae bacterium]|nr:universal stress protein [Acidimicrobiaceae bacterium]